MPMINANDNANDKHWHEYVDKHKIHFPSEPRVNNVYRKEKNGYNNDYKRVNYGKLICSDDVEKAYS